MKKVISILLSLLMMTAMLHFSVASHYCQGNLAASKISFSGKLASCGMEGLENEVPLPGTNFTEHCCDNVVTFCGIDSNYTPSTYFVPDSCQNIFVLSIPAVLPVLSSEVLKLLYTNVTPPGVLMSTNVDLSDICVFRI